MKKMKMTMVMGAIAVILSACGQTVNPEETQTNAAGKTAETRESAGEVQETQNDDLLENLAGEYDYLSDYGTGKLTVKKASGSYDISDYESESSYRFLADPSNIESIEDNKIYIKYPEQTFSDGTAVFGYYILAYDTDEIDVYYGKSSFEEVEFLYHATKKLEAVAGVELTDARDVQYEAFLKNEISVTNPYVEGMNLTVMDDKEYESEFEDAQKKYAYVDVNGDENPELIFKISSYPSELMYILGIYDNQLVCFDVFETHTKNIAFGVYDYGYVWEVQDYDGFGMTFYTYTADGQRIQARHFTKENEADIAAYEGEEPEWIDWQ